MRVVRSALPAPPAVARRRRPLSRPPLSPRPAGTQYIIAVSAASPDTTFTVTATFSTGVITIINQTPMPGFAAAGEYAYYAVTIVNPDVDLVVSNGC